VAHGVAALRAARPPAGTLDHGGRAPCAGVRQTGLGVSVPEADVDRGPHRRWWLWLRFRSCAFRCGAGAASSVGTASAAIPCWKLTWH